MKLSEDEAAQWKVRAALRAAVEDLKAQVAKTAQGGSEEARTKHTKRGKLLPRDRVELLLNGHSLGNGKPSNRFLFTFENVAWQAGTLHANGYDAAGKAVEDAVSWYRGDRYKYVGEIEG